MINEVMPNDWILPNRIGYNEKLYKSFKPDYYSSILKKPKCECDENVCEINDFRQNFQVKEIEKINL